MTPEQIAFMFILISVVIITAFVITTFLVLHNRTLIYRKKIKDESNSTRVFIIDIKKNKVVYFNRSDIRHKKTTDLGEFYDKFHPNDIDKVKGWIFSICVNSKKAEPYLEADVMVNRGRIAYFSLLKLVKFDQKTGLIHIESYLLRYITPANASNKKRRGVT
ncbi:MAG: hypothetical protein HUJ59_03730, partial [Bacilli bacterium]|nr:hypothetical protein [Bacilli bacterium]